MSWSTEKIGKLLKPSGHDRAGSNDFPVLSITMHEGLVDQSSKFKKRIASRDTASYRVVYSNELVVGFPIDEGVLGFQTKYPAGIVSPAYGIWKLALPEETHIPYLEGYLRSGVARGIYASKMRGGVARRRTISKDEFLDIDIPFPPLDEQKRIAAMLDKADALRRQRQESLQLTEKLLQSVFIDMFGDPVTNPKGWVEKELGDLIVAGPQNGMYRPQRDYGTGCRILRIDGFYDGSLVDQETLRRVRLSEKDAAPYLLNEGDIVINRVNSLQYLGKSALIPKLTEETVFESNMMRLRVDQSRTIPEFLIALLQDRHIKAQVAGRAKKAVNQASINQQDVQSLTIFLPPLESQFEFKKRIEITGIP